jgi:hypothetical protein
MKSAPSNCSKLPQKLKRNKNHALNDCESKTNRSFGFDLPVKRSRFFETDQNSCLQELPVEKFYRYVDKLESILNKAPIIIDEETSSSKDQSQSSSQETKLSISSLFQDLNKAEKLSTKHLKVFKKYGIPQNLLEESPANPTPSITKLISNPSPRKIDILNTDSLFSYSPKSKKFWNTDRPLSVKPLKSEFSIKKEILKQTSLLP